MKGLEVEGLFFTVEHIYIVSLDQVYLFSVCLLVLLICLSVGVFNWYFIVSFYVVKSYYGFRLSEAWCLLKLLNLLHLFAPVLRQDLLFIGYHLSMWFLKEFLVSCFLFFLYRLYSGFSFLNDFTLVILRAQVAVLSVNQGSMLKAVLWSIMVYFYKLWLGWRDISLALKPHLLVFI